MLRNLTAVEFEIARNSAAAYYPEANPLVALQSFDARSGTPAYKSIPVRVRAAATTKAEAPTRAGGRRAGLGFAASTPTRKPRLSRRGFRCDVDGVMLARVAALCPIVAARRSLARLSLAERAARAAEAAIALEQLGITRIGWTTGPRIGARCLDLPIGISPTLPSALQRPGRQSPTRPVSPCSWNYSFHCPTRLHKQGCSARRGPRPRQGYGSPDAKVQGARRQSIVKKGIDAREEGVGVHGYA